MTRKQELAIEQMNKALKALKDADIFICGMNNELLWATGKAIKKYSGERDSRGDYCSVARACQNNNPDTGTFDAECYQDSGAW